MVSTRSRKPIVNALDLEKLYSIVHEIIGKKCWKTSFLYDGLTLHFGERIPTNHPKLGRGEKGEWILGTCGSKWILFTAKGQVHAESQEEGKLLRVLSELEDSQVIRFNVSVPDNVLAITFDTGCLFQIIPETGDDDADGPPHWELFMPDNMVVFFGPGRQWSYRRSDSQVK